MPGPTPIRYTGERQETYLSLQSMKKSISAEAYRAAVVEITRRQSIADAANTRSAARKAVKAEAKAVETRAKAALRKAKAASERLAKRLTTLRSDPRFIADYNFPVGLELDGDEIYAVTEMATGKFEISFYVNNKRKRVRIFEFHNMSMSSRYDELRRDFYLWHGSDGKYSIFNVNNKDEDLDPSDVLRIVIRKVSEKIDPTTIIQHYADGHTHCVAEPLARIWDERAGAAILNGSAPATIKKCEQHARACRAYGMQYADGIPEGAPMERMAQIARRRIIIYDILDNQYAIYNATCAHVARFTNTREHHLEYIEDRISLDTEAVKVTTEEMQELVFAHEGQHYLFEGTLDSIKALRSAKGCWRVHNVLHDKYKAHDEINGTKRTGINATAHPELNAYLKASRNVCSAPVRVADGVADGMLDMKYAYTQHAASSYYAGFPAKVHQWRRLPAGLGREFVAKHYGIYKFRVIKNENELLIKLGLTETHILPSPEVLYYLDCGIELELLSGVFMASKDITYAPEMYEIHQTDEGKGKAYAWWAGCQGHDNPNRSFRFKGTQVWANHLAAQFGTENVDIADGIITLRRPKSTNYTNHHTLAFITSYCRINVLEGLKKIKNPVVIQLDAIFYSGTEEEFGVFVHKEGDCPSPRAEAVWFRDTDVDDSFMPILADEQLLSHCVLAGAGGCGKTHNILIDSGFNDVCYVVPQHDLGKAKKKEFTSLKSYTTYNKAAGIPYGDKPTRSIAEEGYFPSVFLFDELTMVESAWVETIMSQHPHALFLVCGDIERRSDGSIMALQCRNGKPGKFSKVFNPPLSWGWTMATTDYRSRRPDGSPDEELIALKLLLRSWMRAGYTDGGAADARKICNLLALNRPTIRLKDAAPMFTAGDTWIAGTNDTSTKLLDHGVCSGWVCRGGPEKGNKSEIEIKGWEKRGSYTTHSYQGQTVKTGKLFVSIYDGFEHAMLYTAISRATCIDQIVLVER